jgi:hypothetical protein
VLEIVVSVVSGPTEGSVITKMIPMLDNVRMTEWTSTYFVDFLNLRMMKLRTNETITMTQ